MFAVESIQENTVYNPYKEVIVSLRDLVKVDKLRVGGYAWEKSSYFFYNKTWLCFNFYKYD